MKDERLVAMPALGSTASSAASLAGATAAELVATIARDGDWDGAPGAAAQAAALARRLRALGDAGMLAHAQALRALETPGDPELVSRLVTAAEAPLAMCEAATDTAILAAEVAERTEGGRWADAAAAAALAAGVSGMTAHLVAVNLAVEADHPHALAARALEDSANEAARRARRAG